MPKIIKEMTVLQLKNLGEGTHTVGGVPGLKIRISHSSPSYFFLRYTSLQGKRRDLTLGSFPLVTLAEARTKAREAIKLLQENLDPIEERKKQKETLKKHPHTFKEAATQWHNERLVAGYYSRDARSAQTTENILDKHVFPSLGQVLLDDITPIHVANCLTPIWTKKNPTAKKALSYIAGTLNFAIAHGYRKNVYNPAVLRGAPLGALLQPMSHSIKPPVNFAACSVDEIPRLFVEMHGYSSMSARACEFAILTAARSKAVRLATWNEFDLDKGIWEIPIEHDKTKVPYRNRTIFLSPQAIALLKSLPRNPSDDLVFMTSQKRAMSDTTLLMFLRGLHEKRLEKDNIGWIDLDKSKAEGRPFVITVHGTARASFRTWAKDDQRGNNRRFDQEAVELCLLHGKNIRTTNMPGSGLGTSYDRALLSKERQFVMNEWGKFCYSLLDKE